MARKQTEEKVHIQINRVDEKTALANAIKTSKYTVWNFLFIFLYEQYK